MDRRTGPLVNYSLHPSQDLLKIKSANHDLTCNILFYDNVNNDIIIMIIIESMKYLYILVVLIHRF